MWNAIGFILLFFVADEIDLKWIAEWRSLSFEEEKFSSDMDFSFKREAVIENEKTIKKNISITLVDTAGQERFRTITKTYYKGAHGIILTYDVTDENSFKNIRNWIKQIEQNAQTNVCKVLVGNKCDKPDRKVSYEEGKSLADEYGMDFFETSAKSNMNVTETFTSLTNKILESNEKVKSDSVKLTTGGKKGDKKGCC